MSQDEIIGTVDLFRTKPMTHLEQGRTQ